jgi:hypothetical protein
MNDVLTADDISDLLASQALAPDVGEVVRHDVDAWLDLSEIADPSSDDGVAIMSFCLEADLRKAGTEVQATCREAFLRKAVGRPCGGQAMLEPVVCFVLTASEDIFERTV